jgi:hypothetical protein
LRAAQRVRVPRRTATTSQSTSIRTPPRSARTASTTIAIACSTTVRSISRRAILIVEGPGRSVRRIDHRGDLDADGTSDLVWAGRKARMRTAVSSYSPDGQGRPLDDAIEISNGADDQQSRGAIDSADADGDGATTPRGAPWATSHTCSWPHRRRPRGDGRDVSIAASAGMPRHRRGDRRRRRRGRERGPDPGAPGASSTRGFVSRDSCHERRSVDLRADATYTYEGATSADALGYAASTGRRERRRNRRPRRALQRHERRRRLRPRGRMAAGTYGVATDAVAELDGDSGSDFGWSLATTDYDNDGTNDLIVGAPTLSMRREIRTGPSTLSSVPSRHPSTRRCASQWSSPLSGASATPSPRWRLRR